MPDRVMFKFQYEGYEVSQEFHLHELGITVEMDERLINAIIQRSLRKWIFEQVSANFEFTTSSVNQLV